MLAMCYQFGHGVKLSRDTTIQLLNDAVDQGSGKSMYSLGAFKLHGNTGIRLLRKATNMNVTAAKGDLALFLREMGLDANVILSSVISFFEKFSKRVACGLQQTWPVAMTLGRV